MDSSYLKSKFASFFLALSVLFVVGMATSVNTQAQYRNDRYQEREQRRMEREQRRREREYRREQRRQARDQGYYGNDGYRRNDGYRNDGYRNDGYGSYGNYGGSYELRQTALNAGYNNGIEEGRKDRSRGERYDFRDEGDYQKATEDYSSRLGDRGLYQRYFRQGFENGYRAGYNGY